MNREGSNCFGFWPFGYILLFIALSFAKAPRVLLETRFWAEEGAYYFTDFRSLDAVSALLYVTNGNYQLLTNVLVYLASELPLAYAPAATTYGAYLVQALVVALIYLVVVRYRIKHSVGLLVVAAWMLVPASYETWASATNVQWICSVSMLFIFALPHESIERHLGKTSAWTLICGLTGVTSCMLAPAFLIRACIDRSRPLAIVGGLLVNCSLVQLWALLTHGTAGRVFPLDPGLLTIPMLLQSIFTPVLGVDATDWLSAPLRDGDRTALAFTWLLGLLLMGFATGLALRAQRKTIVLLIAALWILVSVLNTFGAIEEPLKRFSAIDGGRYYLFGTMCFCLLLAFGTTTSIRAGRIAATGILAIIVATSAVGRVNSSWPPFYTEGPFWRNEIRKCDRAEPCTVAIWPRGWEVKLKDKGTR